MADKSNIALDVKGEQWVSYPRGLDFPKAFASCYPFRGRGIVSRVLYCMNKLHLDRVLLPRGRPPNVPQNLLGDVAFFWPSRKRSTDRFYGYRVVGGEIGEYLKFATADVERNALRREASNVRKASEFAGTAFNVVTCTGVEDTECLTIAKYSALPATAKSLPIDEKWLGRVEKARRAISEAGFQHGDFGWHNLKADDDDRLWILDWEEMDAALPKLTDEVSFYSMLDHYNRGKTVEEVWRSLCRMHSEEADELGEAIRSMKKRGIAMGRELAKYIEEGK